ncbi:MAG: DUF190 domain-containing protein [Acidobacteria bacterium]|nr:DUF190 domain-containing protein [Acidobacteriota bacterium]
MSGPRKVLLIVVKEGDTWERTPLYVAIVHRLRHAGVAGATVQSGIMGFGRHHRIHHKGLFGVPDDRPTTIMAVDEDEKLRAFVADSRDILKNAMTLMLDAELL